MLDGWSCQLAKSFWELNQIHKDFYYVEHKHTKREYVAWVNRNRQFIGLYVLDAISKTGAISETGWPFQKWPNESLDRFQSTSLWATCVVQVIRSSSSTEIPFIRHFSTHRDFSKISSCTTGFKAIFYTSQAAQVQSKLSSDWHFLWDGRFTNISEFWSWGVNPGTAPPPPPPSSRTSYILSVILYFYTSTLLYYCVS